jgi:hypothetical protein
MLAESPLALPMYLLPVQWRWQLKGCGTQAQALQAHRLWLLRLDVWRLALRLYRQPVPWLLLASA